MSAYETLLIPNYPFVTECQLQTGGSFSDRKSDSMFHLIHAHK